MPFVIHTSNRMELLIEALAETLGEPAGATLSPETIVVQSRGMERWISMELARKFGVWGNSRFPFPNKFVWDLFAATMPGVDSSDLFETEFLTWRVMSQLEKLLDQPEFKELQRYLAGPSRALKLYQLAGKIADTYDQYTLYRGDVLEQWEAGLDPCWQALLWKSLAGEGAGRHRAAMKTEFLKRLANGQIDRTLLPRRILMFGLSYMPLFHLEILAGIAPFVDVHVFCMSPCREYWGDITSARQRAGQRESLQEEGNALLASLGGLGKSFSNMILDSGAQFADERENYAESDGDTLLSILQNNILNLVNADPENRIEIAPDDRSLAVHSCHSPMREVEVLHDQLLDMFSSMEGLAPRDILVMLPDIETYAPYISAVFTGIQDPERRIPFTIADRSLGGQGRAGEALTAILTLPGGRFTAPEVCDILAFDPVARAFGMSADDNELVKSWLEETRIRWGMNEDHRASFGLPPYAEGSWMAGLERLVFGYAMSSEGDTLYEGVLPFDNLEGDAAAVLGRFVTYVQSLHAAVCDLERPRTLGEWSATLRSLLQNFSKPADQDSRELIAIGGIIDALEKIAKRTGFSGEIGLDVIRSWLQGRLDREGSGVGFLSGKVTFCAMLPMRSIPVRVVALLGMNDGAFPRQSRSPGFDIIPAHPRPGDRSLRDEDRYLFLEALLSARERLYISYTGQSIRDNGIMPPSVLVSELLDFLDRGFQRGDGDFHKSLLTLHRLQPFSPSYFDATDKQLFSYSSENCSAAQGLAYPDKKRGRFFSGPLTEPDAVYRQVRVEDLLKFFENPSAFIMRHRLGIRPESHPAPLEERETFELDKLEEYGVKRELLESVLRGKNAAELLPLVRARGILPPAGKGDKIFKLLAEQVTGFAEQVKNAIGDQRYLPPLDLDLQIGYFRIYGRLINILPDQMLRYRSAKLSARDQVKLWIEHLLLNCCRNGCYPQTSRLLMLDGQVDVQPLQDSSACLEVLLNRYWQGLILPLHFFPRSSLAFAQSGKISSAQAAWNNQHYPESADPSYSICFADDDPLDGTFEEVALDVFQRYLQQSQGEQ